MKILQADEADLRGILALQRSAYQSEAALLQKPDIPPLKQTLSSSIWKGVFDSNSTKEDASRYRERQRDVASCKRAASR